LTQIDAEADKKGFIAVYPDAIQWFGDKNQSAWNANDGLVPPGTNSNDVQFVNSIIDTTSKQLPVDSNRVYVAGYSNGGILAAEIAKELPNKIAAVGLVSTGMSGANETTDGSPVSVVSIHGTDDPLIPINGFPKLPKTLNRLGIPEFQSYNDATQYWVNNDGASQPIITKDGMSPERIIKTARMELRCSSTPYLVAIIPGMVAPVQVEQMPRSMPLTSCGISSRRIRSRASRGAHPDRAFFAPSTAGQSDNKQSFSKQKAPRKGRF